MKTLLYATGETKKLYPLTDYIASPMLPILNRPVMDYALEVLARQNIKQLDVCLYERPGEVEAYFGDGIQRGLKINYHLQREAWGDAGSVNWAFRSTNDTVLLLPVDIIIDLDLEPFETYHRTQGACLTVLTAPYSSASLTSTRLRVSEGRVEAVEKAEDDANGWISTGVFLISPEVISKIPHHTKLDLVDDVIPLLIEQGIPVHAFPFPGYWTPLETFQQYRDAQFCMCTGKNTSSLNDDPSPFKYLTFEGKRVSEGIWTGRNAVIHPGASIAPRFYMAGNSQVENDVQIGPDVVIGRSVVIDSEATVSESIILDHTYVGRLLNIQSKIVYKNLVIDITSGEFTTIKDEFLLAETRNEHVDIGFIRIVSSVAALGLTILLSPLLLLIGLLLAASGTAVIVKKDKLHTDIRWFVPIEARSMRNFHLLQFQTRRTDGSIPLFGKLIEKLQLQRLPELINIIQGDLAFVGVKPLSPEMTEQLSEEWQKTRFTVPAGLTGLWYLQADDQASLDQVLIADSYYAATHNFKADVNILVQSPKAWIKHIIKRPSFFSK